MCFYFCLISILVIEFFFFFWVWIILWLVVLFCLVIKAIVMNVKLESWENFVTKWCIDNISDVPLLFFFFLNFLVLWNCDYIYNISMFPNFMFDYGGRAVVVILYPTHPHDIKSLTNNHHHLYLLKLLWSKQKWCYPSKSPIGKLFPTTLLSLLCYSFHNWGLKLPYQTNNLFLNKN